MNKTEFTDRQSRRKFIDILLGTGFFLWIGSLLYPVAKFLVPPRVAVIYVNSVEAGNLSEFSPGKSKIIRFGRKPVIVVRQKTPKTILAEEFYALAATCTHLDCIVQYKPDTEQIWCACHNGFYDLQGKNISGPPPQPLAKYSVKIKDDRVIVTLEEMT